MKKLFIFSILFLVIFATSAFAFEPVNPNSKIGAGVQIDTQAISFPKAAEVSILQGGYESKNAVFKADRTDSATCTAELYGTISVKPGATTGTALITFNGGTGAITSTSASCTTITASSANFTGCTATTGIFTTITGFTTMTGTSATVTGITSLTATNVTATSCTATNAVISTGSITNLTGTNATVTSCTATNGIFTNITGFTTMTGSSATVTGITNLTTTNCTATNAVISTGSITDLTGINATVTSCTATNGIFTNLSGFTDLSGLTNLTTTNCTATTAVFSSLTCTTGAIVTLTGTNATSTNCTATNLVVVTSATLPANSISGAELTDPAAAKYLTWVIVGDSSNIVTVASGDSYPIFKAWEAMTVLNARVRIPYDLSSETWSLCVRNNNGGGYIADYTTATAGNGINVDGTVAGGANWVDLTLDNTAIGPGDNVMLCIKGGDAGLVLDDKLYNIVLEMRAKVED